MMMYTLSPWFQNLAHNAIYRFNKPHLQRSWCNFHRCQFLPYLPESHVIEELYHQEKLITHC